jgi:hypothetical protein
MDEHEHEHYWTASKVPTSVNREVHHSTAAYVYPIRFIAEQSVYILISSVPSIIDESRSVDLSATTLFYPYLACLAHWLTYFAELDWLTY